MTRLAKLSALILACSAFPAFGQAAALFDSNDLLVAEFNAGRISIYDENFQFKGYLATGIGNVIGLDRAPNGDVIANIRNYGVYDIAPDGTIVAHTSSNGVYNPGNVATGITGTIYLASQSGSIREMTPDLTLTGRTFGTADDYSSDAVVPGNKLWISGYPVGTTKVYDLASGSQVGNVAWQGGQSRGDSMKYSVETNTVIENDYISGKIYEYSLAGTLLRTLTPGVTLGGGGGDAVRGFNNEYWEISYNSGMLARWDSSGNWIGTVSLAGVSGGFALQWTGAAHLATTYATPTWVVDAGGAWTGATNWSTGSAPSGSGVSATFSNFITAPRTVQVPFSQTVGTLNFNSAQPYTLVGSGSLFLADPSAAHVNVTLGSHSITAPVKVTTNTTMTVATGSTIAFATVDGTSASVSITGGGTVAVTGRLNVASLQIDPAAHLDLRAGAAILSSMTLAAVTSEVTSRAVYSSDNNPLAGIGVIPNLDGAGHALYSSFAGAPASPGVVLAKYTYLGDTDLSGAVDGNDLANLLAGMNGGLAGWQNGDTNYDGVVNSVDLANLLASLQGQGAPFGDPDPTGGAGSVPEPSAIALLPLASLASRRRRDRPYRVATLLPRRRQTTPGASCPSWP